MRLISPIVLLAVGALVAGCGGGQDHAPTTTASGAADMRHVHGIGVNPRDGSLFIATHTGLFRAAQDGGQPVRVGDHRQDTMGFTVVGADRFLASGHPDLEGDQPPLLGLVRSEDAGKSWTPVSLRGKADFHSLEAAGGRIYGYESTTRALMVSPDEGRTWSARKPPAPILDLAIDPRDAKRLAVATPDGLYGSRDGGRRWTRLGPSNVGLLAWTDALYLFGGDGIATKSVDGGRNWQGAGSFGGMPVAVAADDRDLYVATDDGRVLHSPDAGATWQARVTG